MEIMNMKLKMMSTLWENTYRVAIEDGQGGYIGLPGSFPSRCLEEQEEMVLFPCHRCQSHSSL